jgi:predicted dehydrogenase
VRTVKVGVIGTGFIGPAHIEALSRLRFIDIVAIADVNTETAEAKAKQLNVKKAYGNYKDLLSDSEIESVHICTPNNLHHSMARDSLLAGKHVVLEKPFAMNSAEGRELIEIASKTGLINAMHFNIRFYPLVQEAREMIKNGELGEILAINGSYQQDWLFYPTDYNWRLEPEFSGESRAIADIGSHWLDLMEYITFLKVEKVCADFCTFYPVRKKPLKPVETFTGKVISPSDYKDIPINTEDYASVLLRFNNKAHGSLTVNQVAAGRKNRLYFEIYGSKKAISWDCENPNEMWIGNRDSENGLLLKDPSIMHDFSRRYASYPGGHTEGFPDTSKQLFKNVYSSIIEKDSNYDYPTFKDGFRELLLCDSIVKSAKSDSWVTI